jgi:pimeloyl-ACP methyl ester carboxylesterase
MDRRAFISILAGAATSSVLQRANAQPVPNARNVVLVHGLFADGSCWSEVIARLQPKGIQVTAVQNPLTTLEHAVAETQRVLDRQDGPTVLAGHSFSGMIVTEVGVHPNVSAVVYVAARAPDAEEDYAALASKFPTPPATARALSSMGTKEDSPRLHFYAILPVICPRRELACSTRSNSRFTRRF